MTHPDDIIRLLNHSERLEALPRTGWLFAGVTNPESVAAHSYNVSIVAMWLATQLNADVGKTVQMAILHDLGECETTDIPSPVKKRMTGVRELEAIITVDILSGLPAAQRLYSESREESSLEAQIVKAADAIQMVAKACQYARQNRGNVDRFLKPRSTGLDLADDVIARLLERHRTSDWGDLEYGSS